MSLMVDKAADLTAAPIQVVFDPKVVKLNDVAQGDLFAQGGIAPTMTKNIQNDAGGAAIQLNRPTGRPRRQWQRDSADVHFFRRRARNHPDHRAQCNAAQFARRARRNRQPPGNRQC